MWSFSNSFILFGDCLFSFQLVKSLILLLLYFGYLRSCNYNIFLVPIDNWLQFHIFTHTDNFCPLLLFPCCHSLLLWFCLYRTPFNSHLHCTDVGHTSWAPWTLFLLLSLPTFDRHFHNFLTKRLFFFLFFWGGFLLFPLIKCL